LDFLQHHTNTLQPTETGIVMITVTFGPGTKEVHICKPSAAKPIPEITAQTPS